MNIGVYGGLQLSQQNQNPHGKNKIPHGKTKDLTAKIKYLTAKAKTKANVNSSRQKQKLTARGKTRGKSKYMYCT